MHAPTEAWSVCPLPHEIVDHLMPALPFWRRHEDDGAPLPRPVAARGIARLPRLGRRGLMPRLGRLGRVRRIA